jgi:hypothetical protein
MHIRTVRIDAMGVDQKAHNERTAVVATTMAAGEIEPDCLLRRLELSQRNTITTRPSKPATTHTSQTHATQHDTWQFHARAHSNHRERVIRVRRNGFVVTAMIPPSYTRHTTQHTVGQNAN